MNLNLAFSDWYNSTKISKPLLEAFNKMPTEFRVGMYMAYFNAIGLNLTVTTVGYKLSHYPIETLGKFLVDEFYKEIPIIQSYEVAIKATFEYIKQPF